MNTYTHTSKDTHEPQTFVKFIRSNLSIEELGLSADWAAVDKAEVSGIEMLTGMKYAEYKGFTQISKDGNGTEKWGRL